MALFTTFPARDFRYRATFSFICVAFAMTIDACVRVPAAKASWPAASAETKPWTRWWWHGSALTKEGITAAMETYARAGIGGVEITPIYGVIGHEREFVPFLSEKWMALLEHALKEGERLGLGVDMATGTGWPFGGPWIADEHASKNVRHRIYALDGGQKLPVPVSLVQEPYLRRVGNPVIDALRKKPEVTIRELADPVFRNDSLQVLAIDQVQFEKELELQAVVAFNEEGQATDLTGKVGTDGMLDWVAPPGKWKVVAVFQGWHGKMVERAAPGGEGYVIDHFSRQALTRYLLAFDSAFAGHDITGLRSFFNDSYEVDDARGDADWTPEFFDEFRNRRGYELRDHLDRLFGADDEQHRRVLCDYRETLSDLLLENFTQPWKQWAHTNGAKVRNQAHGSPANILDLYAASDIPETEGTEPLRVKMASSAANVAGRKLVSSESATWLNDHFESNLHDIRNAVDVFLLSGVNHVFYHGTAYSPPDEPWPGWLFYAAVHLNPNNPLWNHFDALNAYVTRAQSFLQNSSPDHDVLLYYPVYDKFSEPGNEGIRHFSGSIGMFDGSAFEQAATAMLAQGYTFDFISDRQIQKVGVESSALVTEGGSRYKTIVVPQCDFIPVATLEKIIALAADGAAVVFFGGLPESFAGFGNLERNRAAFQRMIGGLPAGRGDGTSVSVRDVGSGRAVVADSLHVALREVGVDREQLTDAGFNFLRKRIDGNRIYFIKNQRATFDGWLKINANRKAVVIYNPMKGTLGKARTRASADGKTEVYIQAAAEETLILQVLQTDVEGSLYGYHAPGMAVPLTGRWAIRFVAGGPTLPAQLASDTVMRWTDAPAPMYAAFSGSATYTVEFPAPAASASRWVLELGAVGEAASVSLNGKVIGELIGPPFQLEFDSALLRPLNTLELTVSNGMANRIVDLDKKGVRWKKFYNINFPANKLQNRKDGLFYSGHWPVRPSGIRGPVRLVPVSPK